MLGDHACGDKGINVQGANLSAMSEGEAADDVVSEFPFQGESSESDETYLCDVCEQEFDTERGRNIHRGQAHRSE